MVAASPAGSVAAVGSGSAPSALMASLRRLLLLGVALVLSVSLVACDGSQGRKPPSISPADMAVITRQAEGFLAARDRLPELATLVNERDWTFTRNLIHGPMQEVGREMLYINQRLLPADRAEANERARSSRPPSPSWMRPPVCRTATSCARPTSRWPVASGSTPSASPEVQQALKQA